MSSTADYQPRLGAPGTPVIVTSGSAMRHTGELGWKVATEPFFNNHHGAWWDKPLIGQIRKAYEKAHRYGAGHRQSARDFAEAFHIDTVTQEYWKPILEQLEATK